MFVKKFFNKIVICNYFFSGNCYGYVGYLKGWCQVGGFEVNFIFKYKVLVEVGYNVLVYDLCNYGYFVSGQNKGYNLKFFEYKDVFGLLNYVCSNLKIKDMDIYLQFICLGGNVILVVMEKYLEVFEDIKLMIFIQLIFGDVFVCCLFKNLCMGKCGYDVFECNYCEIWGFCIEDSFFQLDVVYVKVLIFVIQVCKDVFIYVEEDVQVVYDNILVEDKKFYWIEDMIQWFCGY